MLLDPEQSLLFKYIHVIVELSCVKGKGKVVPVLQLSTMLWRCIGGVEV